MKSKRIAIDGMLAAMCAVLGYIAIDLNYIKITFETLPIILAGIMFGPLDGLITGAIGTLIYQLLKYGVSATTVLWMLPYCVMGLGIGFYGKKHNFHNTKKEMFLAVLICELLVTGMNTYVMYIDSVLYGYYFKGFITAGLLPRILVTVAKAAAFGAVIDKITTAVKKAIK